MKKKILLGLGFSLVPLLPITAVVACGSVINKETDEQKIAAGETKLTKELGVLSTLTLEKLISALHTLKIPFDVMHGTTLKGGGNIGNKYHDMDRILKHLKTLIGPIKIADIVRPFTTGEQPNDEKFHIATIITTILKKAFGVGKSITNTQTDKTLIPRGATLATTDKFNYSFIHNNQLLQNDKFWTLPSTTYTDNVTGGTPSGYYSKAVEAITKDTKHIYPQMTFENWYNTYDSSIEDIQNDANHTYASTAPKDYSANGSQYNMYKTDSDLPESGSLLKTGNNNNPYNALYSGAGFAYPSKTFNLLTAATPNGQYIPNQLASNGWEHMTPQSKIKSVLGEGSALSKLARADLHNLRPSIQGDFNAPRNNYMYGMVTGDGWKNGVDFEITSTTDVENGSLKVVEPRINVRGDVARASLYMHDRYHITFDKGFYKLMILWAAMDPVTPQEIAIDTAIKTKMGFSNDYITGKKQLPVVPEIKNLLNDNMVVAEYTSISVGDTYLSGNPIEANTAIVNTSPEKSTNQVQELSWTVNNPDMHTFTLGEKPSGLFQDSELIANNFYLRIQKLDNTYQYLIVTDFQTKAIVTKALDGSINMFKISINGTIDGAKALGMGAGKSPSYNSMDLIQEVLMIKN
ncbi:endonuclease [Candidatus Mycoplasma mahonii]|uniref:endonuclease n=1 Tax=Candidatus Mycoplasma mahonii TaxID=3004105 RepID=UPI0026EA08FD|nr:endonuclease [Candidatus Mycoplasma mahonii]WKX02469.1 endonuclease [Candidatus Mycoplasma mahonii]